MREAVLKAYPQIAQWLQPVFASLDEKTLQQLNASIAVEGLDAKKLPQIICSKRAAEVDYPWLFAVITAYRCCWPVSLLLVALPFVNYAPNRLLSGEGRWLYNSRRG